MPEAMTMTAPVLAVPSLWAILKEDLACVFQRDPAARSTLEVLTTYPGVHAVLTHRLSHKLWRAGWRFPARLLSFAGRTLTNVDIHPGATIGRRFFIDHGACVVIGETAEVGDDVTLYHGVTLGGTSWNKESATRRCLPGLWLVQAPKFLARSSLANAFASVPIQSSSRMSRLTARWLVCPVASSIPGPAAYARKTASASTIT